MLGINEKNFKIAELEDKVARTFAEMENQRRRFEKEKDEAFEYGGYSFAKEALNLIDNAQTKRALIFFFFQFLSFFFNSL